MRPGLSQVILVSIILVLLLVVLFGGGKSLFKSLVGSGRKPCGGRVETDSNPLTRDMLKTNSGPGKTEDGTGNRDQRVGQEDRDAERPVASHGLGRARRLEYLPIAFVLQLVFWFLERLAEAGCDPLLLSVFWTALFAAFVIESIRRLHDCGMSGWMVLTFIIPLFWLVTWMRGTKGPNKYGPDPRGF